MQAEPRGGSLLIMNVKPSNEGIYVCTARNAFGEDSGQIQVNIEEASKMIFLSPQTLVNV